MTVDRLPRAARHRGRQDPIGTTLTALWAAGHVAAAVLLGVTVHTQHELHGEAAPPARTVPDHDPTV